MRRGGWGFGVHSRVDIAALQSWQGCGMRDFCVRYCDDLTMSVRREAHRSEDVHFDGDSIAGNITIPGDMMFNH